MKQIKLIFESDNNGELKKFGYVVDKDSRTYAACEFDAQYQPIEIKEQKTITDSLQLGQKIARLIKFGLDEK
jgi:hypothetical protein